MRVGATPLLCNCEAGMKIPCVGGGREPPMRWHSAQHRLGDLGGAQRVAFLLLCLLSLHQAGQKEGGLKLGL